MDAVPLDNPSTTESKLGAKDYRELFKDEATLGVTASLHRALSNQFELKDRERVERINLRWSLTPASPCS